MSVPRAKRKRNTMSPEKKINLLEKKVEKLEAELKATKESRLEEFITTVAMMFSISIRDLWTVLGWKDKRVSERIFSQLVLFSEVSDGLVSPSGCIKDTEKMTGINSLKLINQIMQKHVINEKTIYEMMKERKKKNE